MLQRHTKTKDTLAKAQAVRDQAVLAQDSVEMTEGSSDRLYALSQKTLGYGKDALRERLGKLALK